MAQRRLFSAMPYSRSLALRSLRTGLAAHDTSAYWLPPYLPFLHLRLKLHNTPHIRSNWPNSRLKEQEQTGGRGNRRW